MTKSISSNNTRLSSTLQTAVTFTSGNDFYDDGYNETELDAQIHCKLDFRNTQFFGRSKELDQLKAAFEDIVRPSHNGSDRKGGKPAHRNRKRNTSHKAADDADRHHILHDASPAASQPRDAKAGIRSTGPTLPAAFLWGLSGTGKSRLVKQLAASLGAAGEQGNNPDDQPVDTNTNTNTNANHSQPTQRAYFIQGKNDETTGSKDPFSAIVQTLSDFCQQVISEPKDERKRMTDIIRDTIGGEVQMMATIVPSIASLLETESLHDGPREKKRDKANKGSKGSKGNSGSKAGGGASPAPPSSAVSSTRDQIQGGHQRTNCTIESDSVEQMVTSSDKAWNKLQYMFGSFIKAIATRKRPVVMFLDDMQWSSQVALDLLATLLQDKQLSNFLLIGAIRQEANPHSDCPLELAPTSPLASMFDKLHSSQHHAEDHASPKHPQLWPKPPPAQDASAIWTDIHLANMTQDDVGLWLSQLLDREVEELQPLTSKIYTKTEGNVFFMLQLLEELERCNAIVYSRISFQWEWHIPDDASLGSNDLSMSQYGDQQRRKQAFASAGNVVQLMAMKLNNQPAELRTALIIASYIRFSFDVDLLEFVLREESIQKPPMDGFVFAGTNTVKHDGGGGAETLSTSGVDSMLLSDHLEEAVLEGLLSNPVGSKTFRFAHDRIQQAALGLVPFGEMRSKLKHRIGLYIWRMYCEQNQLPLATTATTTSPLPSTVSSGGNEGGGQSLPTIDASLLFVAADHLNCIPTKDHPFSLQLNLEVGEQALKMAALAPAAMYLQLAYNAFRKLRAPWENHYDLSLRLHQLRADAELTLGHYQLGYDLGREVLERADTTEQKLSVYSCMAAAYAKQDRQDLCMKMNRETVRLLGRYPKRGYVLHVIRDMLWLTSYLRRHTDEQILSLPVLNDKKKILSNKFMFQIMIRAYTGAEALEWLMSSMKTVRMSLEHGLCPEAALGFVSFGMVQSAQGNQDMAVRLAGIANAIIRQYNDPYIKAWIDMIDGLFISGWHEPAASILEKIHRGFSVCMQQGDFETGFFAWLASNLVAAWEGHPLGEIQYSYEAMFEQMALFKVSSSIDWFKEHAKVSAILLGEEGVDWNEIARFGEGIVKTQANAFFLHVGYWIRILLATYFQRSDVTNSLFKRLDKNSSDDPGYHYNSSRFLCVGLMAASLYRDTKRPKFKRLLKTTYKNSRSAWLIRGECYKNRHLIIRAEYIAATSKNGDKSSVDAVKAAFRDAIFVSSEIGHVHEAGLACERFAKYLIMMKMNADVTKYMTQACTYYQRWGAIAKVGDLRKSHSQYIDEDQIGELIQMYEPSSGQASVPPHLRATNNRLQFHFGTAGQSVMVGSAGQRTSIQSSSSQSGDMRHGQGSGNGSKSSMDATLDDEDVSVLTDRE